MAEFIKQHYIPVCYLKNFTLDGKSFFIYSKANPNKIFSQSIFNIACEDKFYDVVNSEFQKETGLDYNTLEKDFFAQTFEPHYNEILKKIISRCNEELVHNGSEILDQREIDIFSELIAVQYLRLPQFRDKYWNLLKDGNQKRSEIILGFLEQISGRKADEITLQFDEKRKADYHAGFLFDENFRYDIQEALRNKIWIFYFTDETVYTSDNPILCKPHSKGKHSFIEGFAMEGVEVIFPISKNVILTMCDQNYFKEKQSMHNKVFSIESKKLWEYNLYQYFFSKSRVFAHKDDFEKIILLKRLNGNKEYFSKPPSINVY